MKDAYDNYGHDKNTGNLVGLTDDTLLATGDQIMPLQGNIPGNLKIKDRDVKQSQELIQTDQDFDTLPYNI